ncbi:MAG: DUF2628 domain-containing protein, partial [Rickettsiales bacterium]|nr:DUF2628 domain-containing protein [Rickettsiales bacterium]
MKNYSIFVKQSAENGKIEDVLLIRVGFNWKACVFNVVWLMFNKLWLFSFLFFMCYSFTKFVFSPFVGVIFLCLFCVLLGFEAENVLFYRLKK